MSAGVTAVGELLCDLLPGRQRPGGAPANFAFHVQQLAALAPVFGVAGNDRDCVAQIGRRQKFKAIALTRGARGSFFWTPHETAECPAIQVTVHDTIGAGDAYTAALTLGLLHHWPASQIVRRAGEIAAFVCTQSGAMPMLPEPLREVFLKSPSAIN